MRLQCLGGLVLEDSDFSQRASLALLAYLAIEGKQSKNQLAAILYPNTEDDKKGVLELLRRLSNEGDLISIRGEMVELVISSDAQEFQDFLRKRNLKEALQLYTGRFLEDLENYQRFQNDVYFEWLFSVRETLQARAVQAHLNIAEEEAFNERFKAASEYALAASRLEAEVSVATPQDYRRIHTLLLAAEHPQSSHVADEAYSIYSDLMLCETPMEARARLTRTYNFPSLPKLYGRESEIQDLCSSLSSGTRLLNIVGMAGVGKSVIATETALRLRDNSLTKDSLGFISFRDKQIENPTQLCNLMAKSLDLAIPKDAIDTRTVSESIADQSILILLDDFEQHSHLVTLLNLLLKNCPRLVFLITSRKVLDSPLEEVYWLKGLSYPSETKKVLDNRTVDNTVVQVPTKEKVNESFTAIDYLKAMVTQQLGTKTIDDSSSSEKFSLLSYLTEGNPLIMKLLSEWHFLPDIQSMVKHVLPSNYKSENKNKNLSVLFESWLESLSSEERECLKRLQVFQSSFQIQDCLNIGLADPATLQRLVKSSFLEDEGIGRFRMHRLLNHFLQTQHNCDVSWYLRFSDYTLQLLRKNKASNKLDELPILLQQDNENLKSAWDIAIEHFSTYEALTTLADSASGLRRYFELSNQINSPWLLESLQSAIDKAIENNALEQSYILQAELAWLNMRLGNYIEACHLAKNAEQSDSHACQMIVQDCLHSCYAVLGQYDDAMQYAKLKLSRFQDNNLEHASALGNYALLACELGNYQEAEISLEKAYKVFLNEGKQSKQVWLCNAFSKLYIAQQEWSSSQIWCDKGINLAEKLQLSFWLPRLYLAKSQISLGLANHTLALQDCCHAKTLAEEAERTVLIAECLIQKAYIALAEKQLTNCETYLVEAKQHLMLSENVIRKQQLELAYAEYYWQQQNNQKFEEQLKRLQKASQTLTACDAFKLEVLSSKLEQVKLVQ